MKRAYGFKSLEYLRTVIHLILDFYSPICNMLI